MRVKDEQALLNKNIPWLGEIFVLDLEYKRISQ